MKEMWEIKQSAEKDTLDIYIYDDVQSDGWCEESETSANHFRKVLEENKGAKQMNIYINSRGGSVFEGTAIYNQLKRHPANKTVYIDGLAGSIASVVAMAGDKVIMPKNAVMAIHNMWTYAVGNATELRKVADDLDVMNNAGRTAYLEKCGDKLSEEKLIEMMDAETWLTAEECIKYGFADEYAEKEADMTKAAELLEKANLDIKQRIRLQQSMAAQLNQIVSAQMQAQIPAPADPPKTEPPKKHKFEFIK